MGHGPRGYRGPRPPRIFHRYRPFPDSTRSKEGVMTFLRWNRLPALGAGLLLLACGGDGGGGPGPCTPGPATQLAKNGGGAPASDLNQPPPPPPPAGRPDGHKQTVPRVRGGPVRVNSG